VVEGGQARDAFKEIFALPLFKHVVVVETMLIPQAHPGVLLLVVVVWVFTPEPASSTPRHKSTPLVTH